LLCWHHRVYTGEWVVISWDVHVAYSTEHNREQLIGRVVWTHETFNGRGPSGALRVTKSAGASADSERGRCLALKHFSSNCWIPQ
jgi:hypothetical protein